ncbi:hypothetical protein UlMin_038354 [Ulmus minor]
MKLGKAPSTICLFSPLVLVQLVIPCRAGMCTTPLHVTSSQLIASKIFLVTVVKSLLYPGAAANGIIKNMTVPSWDNLFNIYNLTNVKEAPVVIDLQFLELLLSGWSPCGTSQTKEDEHVRTLLIIWGLVKEGILGMPVTTDPTKVVYARQKKKSMNCVTLREVIVLFI